MSNTNYTSLAQYTEIVQKYAESIAKDYGIRANQFRITLDDTTDAAIRVKGGPVVQIVLKFPECVPKANSWLRSAFNGIVNRKLIHPVEILPFVYSAEQRSHYLRWIREKIGDGTDIITNLVPRSEYLVEKEITVKVIHRHRKIKAVVKDPTGTRPLWDMEEEGRFMLTKAMQKEVEREQEQKATRTSTAIVLADFYEKQAVEWLQLTVPF